MSSTAATLNITSDQTGDGNVSKIPEKSHHNGESIFLQSSLF